MSDFPLMVKLGGKMPSFGLHRFKQGLRFVPHDDEGFILRGDRRRLLYKGRRRSHRFTILGDTSFEYDCILEREPESNVITLLMEGAECFDFFRQPDFVKNPFLKGSYAVYKKETLIGEGTGKLCHIHRPLIIDARGRRVWGELAVAGNELRITVPEQWLSAAKYPVAVDPTVGTTTVGSFGEYEEWMEYEEEEWVDWDEEIDGEWGEYVPVYYEGYEYFPWELTYEYFVNKYTLPSGINGLATAYTYITSYTYNCLDGTSYTKNYNQGIYPMLFADVNDNPLTRISTQEQPYSTEITTAKPGGWRSATFMSNGYIPEGSHVWFGYYAKVYSPFYFDYGARSVMGNDPSYGKNIFKDNFSISYTELSFPHYNLKLSTYFTYTGAFIRTLTQGVTLGDNLKRITDYKRTQAQNINITDSRKMTADYQRTAIQNVPVTDKNNLTAEYQRTATQTVEGETVLSRFEGFFRQCVMNVANSVSVERLSFFLRTVFDRAENETVMKNNRELTRQCDETAAVTDETQRKQGFFRRVSDSLTGIDTVFFPVLFVRSVNDTATGADFFRHLGAFVRGLPVTAGSIAETRHTAEYHRYHAETVQAAGAVFRGLLLFVRIFTHVFIRDYLLRRFLIAREELILKSAITRDLVVESKIN
jgi:hypothetical protein